MDYTYSMAMSHLDKWFMSRGWDLLASPANKFDYINLSLQDIYNEDNATFAYETETLTWVINWKHKIFTTTFEIRKIQKAFHLNSDWSLWAEIKPTLFPLNNNECVLNFEWKQIIMVNTVNDIVVTYIKEYEWARYPEDLNKILPIPKRYLPVLFKLATDRAWPINLMASESATYDWYSHAIIRLNKLAAEDWLTDYINVTPAY